MRVALAIAVVVAAPVTAAAEEPAPPQPAPAPEQPEKPQPKVDPAYGEKPAPTVDPAYGERPDGTRNFPAPRGKDIVIVSHPDRSKSNLMLLGALGGGAVLMGAIGLYFHVDARDASNAVAASKFTGEPWTSAHQDNYDRAERSGAFASVFYGIGGGLLLATAITYIVTEPKAETLVIHPHTNPKPTALVAPTRGGAIVGGAWRF